MAVGYAPQRARRGA